MDNAFPATRVVKFRLKKSKLATGELRPVLLVEMSPINPVSPLQTLQKLYDPVCQWRRQFLHSNLLHESEIEVGELESAPYYLPLALTLFRLSRGLENFLIKNISVDERQQPNDIERII